MRLAWTGDVIHNVRIIIIICRLGIQKVAQEDDYYHNTTVNHLVAIDTLHCRSQKCHRECINLLTSCYVVKIKMLPIFRRALLLKRAWGGSKGPWAPCRFSALLGVQHPRCVMSQVAEGVR